jgi:hypothetical protein
MLSVATALMILVQVELVVLVEIRVIGMNSKMELNAENVMKY